MTIESLIIPEGVVVDRNFDANKLVNEHASKFKTLPVGIHNITPPHMLQLGYNQEVEVFRDGTGIVRRPEGLPPIPGDNGPQELKHKGEGFILAGRGQTPQELRFYGAVLFMKGKSPKK